MSDGQAIQILPMQSEHIPEVAQLHIEGIKDAFIGSLGIDFVKLLYEGIVQSQDGFGLVAEENGKVLGFVAFTTNLSKLYKSVILKKGVWFILRLASKIFSLRQIKSVFETLFYPSRIKKMNLPHAELLSIAVAEEVRRKGLASELVGRGLEACRTRGIAKVKVLVAVSKESANKLYQNCGFEFVGQTDSHGSPHNIYVAKVAIKEINEKAF
jgi:ribosomal protein S18 acetylase RimI-like enzyme